MDQAAGGQSLRLRLSYNHINTMGKVYEYIIKVRDQASAAVQRIAAAAGTAEGALGRSGRGAREASGAFDGLGRSVRNAVVGFLAFESAKQATTAIFNATAQYQKFDAVLTNSLGSAAAAQQALQMIKDVAKSTPFQETELQESFVKLVNRGIIPTQREIVALGDFAAATGKPFDQLTEAVLDASNPERWKEFGVSVSRANGMATLGFKDQTITVKDNAAAVKDAIVQLGLMEGVAGNMAAQSATLGGQWSNLQDNFSQTLTQLGMMGSGGFSAVIGFLNTMIDKVSYFFGWISENRNALADIFAPALRPFQILSSYLTGIAEKLGLSGEKGEVLKNVFNAIGNIVQWLMPFFNVLADTIGFVLTKVIDVGIAIYDWIKNTEGAQKVLAAFYGGAVAIFKNLALVIKNAFGGAADLIRAVFTGDWELAKQGLSQLGTAVTDSISTMSDAALAGAEEYQKGFTGKDFFEGAAGYKAPTRDGESLASIRDRTNSTSLNTNDKATAGLKDVTDGGKKSINITLNIGKLQDSVNLYATNVQEGVNDFEKKVNEAVLRALNGTILTADQ